MPNNTIPPHSHSIEDLPVGEGTGKIPATSDIPALAGTGFAVVEGTVGNGGSGEAILGAHGLGRTPSIVHGSIVAGTDGGSNSLGNQMPADAPIFSADSVNVSVDLSNVPVNEGGFKVSVLVG